ncbi:DeoR/GlpR family DNA-binding transcription regulator [Limimaricola pyoseonensis]|uniref:DNA-binding transcriptional regulator of sugar metabolism, DeoR/GlpR family n=1 Tax=Limimaricola pyoseonensis TaxID=521013 RepID=A0A1G7L5H5_9RHOB|nr:DeoR/GlpR family DNA-binding transcription regulator [Limimaricola pyoseonensis]SDF44641.1 DNA-binding transcriptional regulator of sugar metabolism, DeoR/GlpR family [Limimaricola pyoseonensis]
MPSSEARPAKAERQAQILLELKLRPHVRIADLAARFSVTPETIRRDLGALDARGQIRRAYGGATVPYPDARRDLQARQGQRVEERARIGRLAAGLVVPGETLMIDAGATTIEFARYLAIAGTPVIAITNCLQVASLLGQTAESEVILCGGRLLPEEAALIGPEAVESLSRYRVETCVIGASAVDAETVSEAVRGFDAIKRVMLKASARAVLLADSSKHGRRDLARVAPLSEIGMLVTDRPPEGALADGCARHGIELRVAA